MGVLTLVPTPLSSDSQVHPEAKDLLLKAASTPEKNLFLMEEPKASRRRWLSWGLPRETIEHFIYFNEHSQDEKNNEIISRLKSGANAFLISDGGLPAYCDPGRKLIGLCHDHGIRVTATPYCNSTSLAIALSGFDTQEYHFMGFPPREEKARKAFLSKFVKSRICVALMDTAYRLKKLIPELEELEQTKTSYFLAMDLGRETEELIRGSIGNISKAYDGSKKDFILIKSPHYGN